MATIRTRIPRDRLPILVIIADGWTRALLAECLEESLLPEIQGELLDAGVLLSQVISVFPSVSLSSHTTLLSGVNQNEHHIPGHRWLTPASKPRSYLGLGIRKVNSDISRSVQTVFEQYSYLPTFSIQGAISRGAMRTIRLPTLSSTKILKYTAGLLEEQPDSLFVVWLPRGDAISHVYGPRSKQMISEMISVSRGIGALAKALKTVGRADTARIIFTSDHGHQDVSRSADLAAAFVRLGHTSAVNPRTCGDLDVCVLTSGDSAAYAYFISRLEREQKLDALLDLAAEPSVGLIFFRYSVDLHYVIGGEGVARIRPLNDSDVLYERVTGKDPLRILQGIDRRNLNMRVVSRNAASHEFPDVVHQYLTSYVANRSADTLITASTGYHFGPVPRIGWRLGYHRGSHGGPSRKQIMVSAIVKGVDLSAARFDTIRSKDLLKLCLKAEPT